MKTNRKCEDNKGIPAPFRLPRLVFLDLDETLVPFQQLLSSTCPTEKKDATIIADAVLEKAEDFMYSSLEDVALLTLGERSLFPVSKLKECQLAMKRYEEDRHDPCESCISPSLERIDLLRDGMTKEAQALLDCLVTNNIKFYIVTASHICSALAKLRLFGLSQYVSARNVYHAIDFNKVRWHFVQASDARSNDAKMVPVLPPAGRYFRGSFEKGKGTGKCLS